MAVTVMMVTMNVNAQESEYYTTKHEVGLTIGSGATTEIVSGLSNFMNVAVSSVVSTVITGGIATGSYSYGDEHYIPTLSAEYYYHVSKGVGLGGFLAFNGVTRDMYINWRENYNGGGWTSAKTGKAKRFNLSIIPTAKFDWLRKRNFGMYSKVGLGASFMFESQEDDIKKDGSTDVNDTTVIPNVQCSLLGIEGGSTQFRGFVELGFGEQGILLAGLRCKF